MTVSHSSRIRVAALASALCASGLYAYLASQLLEGPVSSHWLEIVMVAGFFYYFTIRRGRSTT